jgi:hypothetical protein
VFASPVLLGRMLRRTPVRPHLLSLLLFGAIALAPRVDGRTALTQKVTRHPACARWTVTPASARPSPSGTLNAVTAVSSRNVWGVGSNGLGSALVEHWNGTRWRSDMCSAGERPSRERLQQ